MDNPQITPELIFKYSTKTNEPWNIPQYKVPKQYFDPLLEVNKRKWSVQKKGEPNRNYVTKRGYYMDYPLKIAKIVPGSDVHGENSPWSFRKEQNISKNRKIDPKLIKYTYHERIEMEQKNRKKPGVCTYSLEKSIKQKDAAVKALKNKKQFVGEKHFFYEDTEFLANRNPGAGNYNPHFSIKKVRKNKTQYKEWIKKHKDWSERKQKRDATIPAPGTYCPMNQTFTTFDHLVAKQSPKKDKQKHEGFGTDARFIYTRQQKKKIKELRPSPNSYNTMIEWKGKESPRKRLWYQSITKGSATISVYNC